MSIATADAALAGSMVLPPELRFKRANVATSQIRMVSDWAMLGIPGPGTYDNTLNGVTLSGTVAGQIPFTNPAGGQSSYLHSLMWFNNSGQYLSSHLVDRLWQNGNLSATSLSAQSMTTPTWPARDIDGSTNGNGVLIAIEVESTMGAATPTTTSISYTNSDGTASRTGSLYRNNGMSAAPQHSHFLFGVQADDKGVRSVQSVTLSASWLSGTWHLVAQRIIFPFNTRAGATVEPYDLLSAGMARIYDDSVLHMVIEPNASANGYWEFETQVSQG